MAGTHLVTNSRSQRPHVMAQAYRSPDRGALVKWAQCEPQRGTTVARRKWPAGYGIKVHADDRDRYFSSEWSEVVLEIGDLLVILPLTPSFWRSCSELSSAAIGRWLPEAGQAPWPPGAPPGIIVEQLGGNRFSVRLLGRRSLRRAGA